MATTPAAHHSFGLFDLLVALVERAGRVVTKDELLDAVWGRVVVEEGNLHVHVSALRKLLGPGAIVTIPGRGYQFNPPGPLVSSTDGGAPAAPGAPPPISNAPTESATAPARPATTNTPAPAWTSGFNRIRCGSESAERTPHLVPGLRSQQAPRGRRRPGCGAKKCIGV